LHVLSIKTTKGINTCPHIRQPIIISNIVSRSVAKQNVTKG
jgi:hypothetical protein